MISKSLQKLLDPSKTDIVLRPEYQGKGSWVGAPAACYSKSEGCFYLLVRFRREGVRGYKTVLYRTGDGVDLEKVKTLNAVSLGVRSIERGALEQTGKIWRFYLSYESLKDGLWKLAVAEKKDITDISAGDFEVILKGDDIGVTWVKDPVLFGDMLFVHIKEPSGKATYLVKKVKHGWKKTKILSGKYKWDAYCARITTILKSTDGFFVFYDGAGVIEENQEEKTGLAYGKSLKHLKSITPEGPMIIGPGGSGSIRYLEIKELEDKFYIWYELSTVDRSHELRFTIVEKEKLTKALKTYYTRRYRYAKV